MDLDFSKVRQLRQSGCTAGYEPKHSLSRAKQGVAVSGSAIKKPTGTRQEVSNFLPPMMQETINEIAAFWATHTPTRDSMDYWDRLMQDAAKLGDRHKGNALFREMLLSVIGELEKLPAQGTLTADSFGGRALTGKEAKIADALTA